MLKYAFGFCLLLPATAYADRIDGAWCVKGEHIEVTGPKITLTDRSTTEGKYTRHEFFYTVPAGQARAGEQIYLRLRGEEDMTSFVIKGGQPTEPMDWKRCASTS